VRLLKDISAFLTSTRVGIVVMVILVVLSFLGAMIPQGGTREAYAAHYGGLRGSLIWALGLNDVFRADYFTVLLVFLCIMVFACALKGLPQRLRLARQRESIFDYDRLARMPERAELVLDVDAEEARLHVADICKRRFYSVSDEGRPGCHGVYASKMGLSRLGSSLLHLSFIFLLVGGIVSTRLGMRRYEDTRLGGRFELDPAGAEVTTVTVEDFTIELDERERLSDYVCDVSVRRGRDVSFLYSIRPNHPLEFAEHEVYLVSYGDDPTVPQGFFLSVYDSSGQLLIPHLYAGVDDPDYVEFLGATVQASIGIVPSVRLITDDGGVETYIIRRDLSETVAGESEYRFVLMRTVPSVVVTLEVVREPGQGFIVAGLGLLTLGSFVSLYLSHRRIWFIVSPLPEDRTRLVFGGSANRNRDGFAAEFRQIKDTLGELC
jgi:cytochrome c biogenesis protein